MRAVLRGGLLATAILVAAAAQAFAWHVQGQVFCEGNGLPIPGVTVDVVSTDAGSNFSASITTDQDGFFWIGLSDAPLCYRLSVALGAGQAYVSPPTGYHDFCTDQINSDATRNFVISSPICAETQGHCWLTAGGAKFSTLTGTRLGEHGPQHNWGGNVNPGCSPTAGDGGSWNHIDRDLKLHFHGQHIEVVRCGNVDGIPPGSTSPKTPFNFIEFTGTGTLVGFGGNKADYGTVNFWARCEDRNEPGSSGVDDGNLKDRYFIKVYDNSGNVLLLLDQDGDPNTVDPVTITKGNMQIHVSSCDPATLAALAPLRSTAMGSSSFKGVRFITGPNPARGLSFMRFALPREARVSMAAFDVSGRLVRQLVNTRLPAGEHSVAWNLRDTNDRRVGAGVYYIKMNVDGKTYGRTVTVMQ